MPASLSSSQIAAYENDGFLFPVDVMPASEAKVLRSDIETMEKTYPDALAQGARQQVGLYADTVNRM